MPVKDPLPLTRAQIAEFVGHKHETIRRIERLFEVAGEETPGALESVEIMAGNALSLVNSLMGEIEAYARDTDTTLAVMDAKVSYALNKLCLFDQITDLKPPDNSLHNFSNRDYVDFNISNQTEIDIPGRCLWNIDDGTLNVGLYNEVVLQMGQETHFYAKNVNGAQIDNGQPVMFAGTVGASGKFEIDLAQSDSAIPAEYFMGVATQDIPNNDFGYVTCFGLVRGIDTTGTPVGEVWSDGDLLYLSTTAGELTITPPTSPDPKILVAAVIYSSATIGSIFVRPTWGDYLSSLHDVYITGVSDHDILEWDSTNSRWENTSDPVVDTISVNDNIIFSGTVGEGQKVDIATPTFSWQDLLGEITIRGVAATDPTFTTYRGNIRQYQFNVGDLVTNNFHILHNHAPGLDYYIHVHWSHISAAVTTGSVTWSFEISYAKGHDQAAFPAPKTITVTQNGSTTQYQHMIAEVAFTAETADATHFDRDDIEVDGVIMVATSLNANTLNAATDPFVHYIDIHYQSISIGTKNKAPNFYVT